jgi:hypothetical protein
MTDLERAKNLLTGECTCALCLGDCTYLSTERGVKPLVAWLESGIDFQGFCAADKVVGKATAFLYVLLGVKSVYAKVISKDGLRVLQKRGIAVEKDTIVEYIINRKGDGRCPFEESVLCVDDEKAALQKIRQKMQELGIEIS